MKIILNINQFKKLINETIYHGTKNDFDFFDQKKIVGFHRSRYGWGIYFTNLKHKQMEYGGRSINLESENFIFLDINENADKTKFEEIKNELKNVDDIDYKICEYAIDALNKSKKQLSYDDLNKIILNKHIYDIDKELSLFYKRYFHVDGFIHYDEHVIFNKEKLNNVLKINKNKEKINNFIKDKIDGFEDNFQYYYIDSYDDYIEFLKYLKRFKYKTEKLLDEIRNIKDEIFLKKIIKIIDILIDELPRI
jgi:hypothetical protein